jgi:hypothetical protein
MKLLQLEEGRSAKCGEGSRGETALIAEGNCWQVRALNVPETVPTN